MEIVRAADVSIVTLVPGTGDDVQALKAGIMEIADIFVVNKADREGADRLVSAIEATLSLHSYGAGEWRPPIVKTVATTGAGVGDLLKAVWAFRAHATAGDGSRRHVRSEHRLREILAKRLLDRLEQQVLAQGELAGIVERIASRETDPYSAADALIARLIR